MLTMETASHHRGIGLSTVCGAEGRGTAQCTVVLRLGMRLWLLDE